MIIFSAFNRKSKHIYFVKIIVIIILLFVFILEFVPKSYYEINFLDVGQGDCIHIRTIHGFNILIDGGGSEQSDYDIGEKVLLPYLLKNGIYKNDIIFISRFHEDHVEGLLTILNQFKVNKIIIGEQGKPNNLYLDILKISKDKQIQIITMKKNDIIKIDGIEFNTMYPSYSFKNDNLNNNSLVIRADIFDTRILFTGDMEMEEELLLLEKVKSKDLDIDILKVGHHGSKTSSTEDFLKTTSPSISIISCGIKNKFGHPNNEVLERLSFFNSRVIRTDLSGEIMLKIYKNNQIKISTMIK